MSLSTHIASPLSSLPRIGKLWIIKCPDVTYNMVERKGVEPLTSSMPLKRATNCANAPDAAFIPYFAYFRSAYAYSVNKRYRSYLPKFESEAFSNALELETFELATLTETTWKLASDSTELAKVLA